MAEQQQGSPSGLEFPEVRLAYVEKLYAEARRAQAEADACTSESAANTRRLEAEAARLIAEELQLNEERHKVAIEKDDLLIAHRSRVQEEKEKLAGHKYHHIYYFNSDVSDSSIRDCMVQCDQWRRIEAHEGKAPAETPIDLIFTSPGGSVLSGLVLFDYLQGARKAGHPVTTGTFGYAASMAGILLQAGQKRWMGAGAWVLIHEISAGAVGKIGEIEDQVEWIKKIQRHVVSIFAERMVAVSGGPEPGKTWQNQEEAEEFVRTHWARKDWWISAPDCKLFGIIDEVR